MAGDHEVIKQALTSVIARIHPASKFDVPEEKRVACHTFVHRFDSIFTTNYDLLIYWALLAAPPSIRDAFFEQGGPDYRVFEIPGSSGKNLHYLHGALHIYAKDAEVRKRVWDGKAPLVDRVREGLDNNEYPLIVTEGTEGQKLERIVRSNYLTWCLQEFQHVDGTLFIYGSSLGEADGHLWRAIVENRSLERLAVGINGDGSSPQHKKLIDRAYELRDRRLAHIIKSKYKVPELLVRFFDARTAPVWEALVDGSNQ